MHSLFFPCFLMNIWKFVRNSLRHHASSPRAFTDLLLYYQRSKVGWEKNTDVKRITTMASLTRTTLYNRLGWYANRRSLCVRVLKFDGGEMGVTEAEGDFVKVQ